MAESPELCVERIFEWLRPDLMPDAAVEI